MPSDLKGSESPTPSSSQPCHQPCSPTTTRGSSCFAEARPGPHSAGRGAHVDPITVLDSACRGCRRNQLDLRVQSRACAGLAVPDAGSDKTDWAWRRSGSKGRKRPGQGAQPGQRRFDKIRQGRIAVIKEGLRPEFDFPRRRRKAAWVALRRRSRRAWRAGSSAVSAIRQVRLEADPG